MDQISVGPYTIRRVSLYTPVPCGWRMLAIGEGQKWKCQLSQMLCPYSIVAFDVGKIDGSGYGNRISHHRGSECGEKFIIRP